MFPIKNTLLAKSVSFVIAATIAVNMLTFVVELFLPENHRNLSFISAE